MQEFTDTKGDTWRLEVTFGERNRIKKLLGVDLTEVFSDDLKLMARLSADFELLVGVVAELCSEQVDARGLSAEDFACRFGGDVLESALDALLQAIIDFFPNAQRREKLRQYLERLNRLDHDMREKATPEILSRVDQMLDEMTPEQWAAALMGMHGSGRA